MSSFPFVATSNVFNTADYNILNEGLTRDTADKLYLSLGGGVITGNLNINGTLSLNGSAVDLSVISGVIPGIASASKALIVDTNRDINNINQLSLTGKLVLDQTQTIGFYRNTSTLDTNSYIGSSGIANMSFYSIRGGGDFKFLSNQTGSNSAFMVNLTSTTTPSATNLLTLLANGNFGLGLNSPSYLCDVAGSINSNSNIQVNRTTNGECFIANNGTVRTAIHCQASQAHIGTTTNHGFNIQTNGANRLLISNGGNITVPDTVSGLQLDLGSTGTGLNVPNLTFRGTSFNDTYYTDITTGGAVASKAVVLNSDKDYSGMRDLSITGAFIASTSIASPSIICDTLSSTIGLSTNSLTVNGDENITGVRYSNGTAFTDSTRKFYNITSLDFQAPSLLYKTIIRKSTISGSAGVEIYSTEFSTPSHKPMINFKTGNDDDPIFLRMCGYLNDNDGTWVANGCPFDINYFGNVSYDSGLRLGCINTTQATNNNGNIGLWARNFTIPHFIAQDRFNQAHIKPTSSQLNSQITGYGIVCGENVCMNGGGVNAMRGNATVLSLINTTGSTSDRISFTMDHNTQWEMSLGGSAHAVVPNGLYWYNGSYKMVLTSAGRLGVGVASPRCGLEVSGTANYTTISIGTNTYIYNVSNNSWANLGGGPVTISICAWFNDDIYVNNSVYTTSDRRLKDNIKPLELDIERYKLLKPVSYNYKNQEDKTKVGLIAQDVMKVCGEALTFNDNENMKIEEEGDIEGIQMGMDYNAITVLNVDIIKQLISRIEVLENELKNIKSNIPLPSQ